MNFWKDLHMNVFLSLLVAIVLSGQETKASKPNILFFFADDQRADTINALGNKTIITPNIDQLVKEGTAFERAYIMGGSQGAVCVPSRAMMLSGKSLFRISEQLKGTVTWPMALRDAGYETFATGKWHNGQPSLAASFSNAKSIYLGGMSAQFNTPVSDVGTEGKMINQKTPNDHCSEIFANEAIEFLKKTPKEKPFAAYIAFKSPHDPRQAPKKFLDMYNPKEIPLPANYLPEHSFNNGELLIRDERLEKWPRSKNAVQQHLAEYYAIITHEDEQIGRIIKTLKETGRFENTIIIFSADNGLAIGSHGLMGKQSVYEHSVKIPLVIAGPGIQKNKRSQAMCYTFDLFPTFCEAAGAKIPAGMEGKSLWPVLKGTNATHRNEIFSAYRGLMRGLNDGRYKLIVNIGVNKTQLFDLQNDPDEMQDLAGNEIHKDRVAAMTAKLKTVQGEWSDKQELKSEKPMPLKIDLSKVPEEKSKGK